MLKSWIWSSRVFGFFSFSFLKSVCSLFSSSPTSTSSLSQCSWNPLQRYFCLDHHSKQFSYSLRNKKCIANKYFYLKAIAHNRNRTSIKGDRSIIFQTDLLCLLKSMRQLVKEKQINKNKKFCCPPGSQLEKFRDKHQHPVFSVSNHYGWGI